MTRRSVILAAAAALLAGAGQAQAQKYFDFPEWRDQLLRRRPSLQPWRRQPHSAHQRLLSQQLRAGHDRHQYRRAATLSDAAGRHGAPLRHRRRPRRFPLERRAPRQRQARMARLDAARGDAPPPARSAPAYMEGGIENPLGARALYLGSTLYRIHGSNEPETIGQAVSSGCFRMTNEDVVDLYDRVSVGTTCGRQELDAGRGEPSAPAGMRSFP